MAEHESAEQIITQTQLKALFANLQEEQVTATSSKPAVIGEDKSIRITLSVIISIVGGLALLLVTGWQAQNWFFNFKEELTEPVSKNTRMLTDLKQDFETSKAQVTAISSLGFDLSDVTKRVQWLEEFTKNYNTIKYDIEKMKTDHDNQAVLAKTEAQHHLREHSIEMAKDISQLTKWVEQLERQVDEQNRVLQTLIRTPISPRGEINWDQLIKQRQQEEREQGNYTPDDGKPKPDGADTKKR